MALEESGLRLVAEGGSEFEGTLRGANDAVAGFGQAAERAASPLDAFGEIATGALRRVGEIAINALGAAAGAVGGFISDAFTGALEAEQTLTRISSVIESTGGAAGLTTEDVERLGNQFAHLAGGSDDAVLAIQEMALRLGTISAEEMPDFIQTTLDLAAATGVDAVAAARTLAVAQEDPISALGRLRKSGILLTEAQEEQIKSMVKAGDTAGAYSLLIEQVGEATGGAALANSQTLAGQMEIFKNTIMEAGEGIMTAFLPVLSQLFQEVIAPAIPIITGLASQFASLITTFFATAEPLAVAQAGFTNFLPTIQPIIDAALNLGLTFSATMPQIQATVQGMVDFVMNLFAVFGPSIVANITTTLNTIAVFWQQHGDEVMAIVTIVFNTLAVVIGGILTLISGIISTAVTYFTGVWSAGSALLQGDTETAWSITRDTIGSITQTISATIASFMDGVLSLVGTDLASFTAMWQTNLELAQLIVTTVWTNILTIIQTTFDSIISTVSGALSSLQSLWSGAWDGIWNILLGAYWQIRGQIASLIANIISQFTSVDWPSIGSNILAGIGAGISGAVGGLVQTAVDAAMAAFNAAASALGIGSPSKLAMEGIGRPFDEGIALGIEKSLGLITSASGAATAAMMAPVMAPPLAASSSSSSYNQTVTNNIDARGAQRGVGAEIEGAVDRAMKRAGQYGDTRLRLRGAM